MKKTILAVLTVSVVCLAQSSIISTEKCNPNPNSDPNAPSVNYEPSLPLGWCYDDGYVCQVALESTGGVSFLLGKNSNCQSLKNDIKQTHFTTHPSNSDGSVNMSVSSNYLKPYLQEGPVDNVSGLAVAMNTAFLINASNEKFMVRITYHQISGDLSENSVRLLGIFRKQVNDSQQ